MFIFHKETTLEDLGNGVTRRILAHDGKMMAVEVNFEKGAIGPMHNHPHEQLTYVPVSYTHLTLPTTPYV